MCGIVGKFSLNQAPVEQDLITAMCDSLIYRGPDDGGVYVDNYVGLGHRRLSIIDLSEQGHQPMATPDRQLWITFNGEIYNYRALRKQLAGMGHPFQSNCDTEVILYLYREYGINCLDHLRGMFAFALWDKQQKSLFLARDRIGKKPLFYYYDGSLLLFASEMKAILKDDSVCKEINHEALYDYFKYLYVPAPKTIYKKIHKLEPGHYLLCNKEGISTKEYWDISFANGRTDTEQNVAGELLEHLQESVKLRMVSDVPIGAFLSGGIDSSCLVALMARQNPGRVTTCSISFKEHAFNEAAFARIVADQFKTEHHEFTVHEKLTTNLSRLAYHFDEPFGDSSAVPTFHVSQLARQAVTVALAGDGGDENFAGYQKYDLDDLENRLRRRLPRRLRKSLLPGLSNLLARGSHALFRKSATLSRTLGHEADYGFYITNTEMPDGLWDRLANDETKRRVADYDPFSVTSYYYHKANCEDHLSRILYTDLKTYLPGDILVKVDRMSMANSLEVRAPILDHHVIEFAARIPATLKYRQGEKKYILKQAFRDLLPNEILYRRKMGFCVPLAQWLRGEIKSFAERNIFSANAGVSHFFDPSELRKIWNEHQQEKSNYATILWSFLMFELWFRQFMD